VGYRHYLYKIKKKDVNKIKKLSLKELADKYEEESDYIDFFKIIEKAQPVFEFGKLYWEDTAERIYATGKPLFDNKKVQDNFDDFCPYIVGKKALMVAINIYKDKIKTTPYIATKKLFPELLRCLDIHFIKPDDVNLSSNSLKEDNHE